MKAFSKVVLAIATEKPQSTFETPEFWSGPQPEGETGQLLSPEIFKNIFNC